MCLCQTCHNGACEAKIEIVAGSKNTKCTFSHPVQGLHDPDVTVPEAGMTSSPVIGVARGSAGLNPLHLLQGSVAVFLKRRKDVLIVIVIRPRLVFT